MRRRDAWLRLAAIGVFVLLVLPPAITGQARDTLPASLTDRGFWSLIEQLSEPDGYFKSNSGSPDNLLSNESMISTVGAFRRRSQPPAREQAVDALRLQS